MRLQNRLQGSLKSNCDVFSKQPDPALYNFSCPTTKQLKWTIKTVTRANQGDTWECRVAFAGGSETATYSISVYVPVQSVTMTSPTGNEVTVRENTETMFVCKTSGGLPAATVRWYKDQRTSATSDDADITTYATITTSKTDDDLVSVTSTLRYSPSKEDNGIKIYCTTNNSANTLTSVRKPQLNVQYSPDGPPTIQSFSNGDTYKIIENNPGTLSCAIKGGNPLATLSWSCYNSRTASATVDTTVTRNVTWTVARNQDRSCTCQSSQVIAGTQTVFVNVQILYPSDQPTFKVNGNTVSGPISFIEGKSRNIACEGNGKPTPNIYSWIKGGKTITSGNTLTFSSVQKQDGGQYSCTVQNTMNPSTGGQQTGTNTSNVNVIVLFAPSSPSLYYGGLNGSPITRSSIDVIRGDTFTIACKSEGQPEPTYRWSGQSSDNQILSVTSVSEHDNLQRTCTATNTMQETHGTHEEGSSASTLTFNVSYPPSINSCTLSYTSSSPVIITDSVDVIEGSTFSLTCTASSKPAVELYSWSGPVMSSSDTLTVTTISQQQNGTYTLTAKNSMTRTFGKTVNRTDTKTINVDMLYAPVMGQLTNTDIEAGLQLTKSCPVVKANPPVTTFQWTRNDSRVWNQQILKITNVSKNDDMLYTCTVQNTMRPTGATQQPGEGTGSFHLNVQYLASVTSFFVQGYKGSSSVEVAENKPVPMECNVDSNPGSRIEVKYQGNVLHSQENTKHLVYEHKNATCLDTGVYTCTAQNQFNRGSSSVQGLNMYVRCYPRPLVPVKENVYSALRVTAVLNFTGLAYPKPSGFIWKHEEGNDWRTLSNSSTIHIFISGTDSYLRFNNVSQSDYGKYNLSIQNEVDTYTQTFHLIPEGVPEVPTEFSLVEKSVTETSAQLQWKPGFNGGPEQTFILMYKRSSDQQWINISVIDTGEEAMVQGLTSLASGSLYTVAIIAQNRIGVSTGSRNTTFSTAESVSPKGPPGALIGGAAGGGVAVIGIVVAVLLVLRFRRGKGKSQKRDDRTDRKPVYEDDDDDYGMQDNPMYVSAGPSASGNLSGDSAAVYSTVDKTKAAVANTGNDVYAEVDKTKKTKAKQGDVYENAPTTELKATKAKLGTNDEIIYENPEPSRTVGKKNVNKDGLIYADLTFNDQPKGQKKLVIHGLDDMTEYVEVDFTKKADPLPDSDDETSAPKK